MAERVAEWPDDLTGFAPCINLQVIDVHGGGTQGRPYGPSDQHPEAPMQRVTRTRVGARRGVGRRLLASLLLLTGALGTAAAPGCEPKHEAAEVDDGPARSVMVEQLAALAALIEAGDEAGVRARLVAPPGMPEPQVIELVRALMRGGGVTVAGAKALAATGQYGVAGKVFPIAGPNQAKELQLDPKACYALKHRDTEVLAHWDGKQFRFFRLDNIGKAAVIP